MNHYGLLGHPLGHSLSKHLFAEMHFPEADYTLFDEPQLPELKRWTREKGLSGFNVTSPYKEQTALQMDTLSPEAEQTGAVNCVCVDERGALHGHNTDALAFWQTLHAWLPAERIERAFVLGSGGAAKAARLALQRECICTTLVSRSGAESEEGETMSYSVAVRAAEQSEGGLLLVNATPLGTYPDEQRCPWPRTDLFNERWSVYDLVYNPTPTRLTKEAAERGARVKNGMPMLRGQAFLSWQLWGLLKNILLTDN